MKRYFAENGRGLNANQIEAIKFADAQAGNFLHGVLRELKKPDAEIFMGIRNGYFNLYLGGASIGKFNFEGARIASVEIHKKYLGENSSGYVILPVENSAYDFKKICENIKALNLKNPEKQLQQRLVMANNAAKNSAWYCVDMEYAMQRQNKFEADFGRADIIAISRRPVAGKYKLLMIELKIGSGSFGTNAKYFPQKKLTASELLSSNESFGSGIFGHFADFVRYAADKNYDCGGGYSGRFTKLRGEAVNILENYSALGILPDLNLTLEDIFEEPTLVFLIYGSVERSFRNYVCGKSERAIVKACDENFVAEVFRLSIKCVFRDEDFIFRDEGISDAARIF